MSTVDDYTVRLENFEGPLDLLLYLIRKAEVEITAIPIAEITDQFMRHLHGIDRVDIDLAGEFLVMAATLMELKSRVISPVAPGDEGAVSAIDEAMPTLDPRSELVQQLLAFKWCRDAAEALEERRGEWERRYPSGQGGIDRNALREAHEQLPDVELEDLELYDLVEAFSQIVRQVDFSRLGDHQIALDDTPIEEHMTDVVDHLKSAAPDVRGVRRMPFKSIFAGRRRGELIGLFLALLELVRQRMVTVRQDDLDDEISVQLNDDPVSADEGEAAAPKITTVTGGERVEVESIRE
ncbi:MAG: segregation/condensation protein A [Planctomycetota bacterium]|nr:segregation/condensation protein A [Planctomycetota bacterium]